MLFFVCLYVCLFVCLFVCWFIYLFIDNKVCKSPVKESQSENILGVTVNNKLNWDK
jgi:hypothetical protein